MSAVLKIPSTAHEGAVIETITPHKAKQYLATMVQNRHLSQAKMLEYAIAIEADGWALNGESIKFDEQGRLFDGQHRLEACILADKPFRTYVIRGVRDPRAMSTVDTGKNRSHTDVWTISGLPNGALGSSTANILYLYEKGRVTWKGVSGRRMSRATPIGQKLKVMPTAASNLRKDELLAYATPMMDELQASVRFAMSCRAKSAGHPSAVAALHFLAVRKGHREQVESFLRDVGQGVGLEKGDPAFTVREHILFRSRSGARLSRYYVLGVLMKAFNARLEGRKLQIIKVQNDEEFPKIK